MAMKVRRPVNRLEKRRAMSWSLLQAQLCISSLLVQRAKNLAAALKAERAGSH